MKYALVDGIRREPQPGLSGDCPSCGGSMVARCGELRIWHWAHKGRRHCDPWWENETDWHRAWKGNFPDEWQEIVQHDDEGEKHIADVRTGDGWVLEFQHSYINAEERRSREAFYPKLVWVVDGLRRSRDEAAFHRAWAHSTTKLGSDSRVRQISRHEGALLKDWAESRAHVLFDFGDDAVLWWLLPRDDETWKWAARIPRAKFLGVHQKASSVGGDDFESLAEGFFRLVSKYDAQLKASRKREAQRLAQGSMTPLQERFVRRHRH